MECITNFLSNRLLVEHSRNDPPKLYSYEVKGVSYLNSIKLAMRHKIRNDRAVLEEELKKASTVEIRCVVAIYIKNILNNLQ